MVNTVPCKRCNCNFEYKNNTSGNARQLCDECRAIVDEEEIKAFKEQTIVENNKYLFGAPGHKEKYDISEVYAGNFPTFESDIDRFTFAIELGEFIKKNGFMGAENHIATCLKSLPIEYCINCMRLWPSEVITHASKFDNFKSIVINVLKITDY